MFSRRTSRLKHAISRGATIGIVVVVIIIIAVGGYAAIVLTKTSSSTTPTTTGPSSTTTGPSSTTSFTWETENTPQYLDPQVSYFEYDYNIIQNVYEPLLWYNGNSSTQVIPWLASNYTVSSDGKTMTINLRQGIKFADGEPFNSTAVYFSLNRLLIDDGSSPVSKTSQAAWIVQQLLNSTLGGLTNSTHGGLGSSEQWVQAVLGENFVQITGTYSVQLNIQNPNPALPYFIAGEWSVMVAPDYTISHDLALWNGAGTGYVLPYATLNSSLPATGVSSQFEQYYADWASTCTTGITPKGCGTTYYDGSAQGSLGGTGPYVLTSATTSQQVMTAKSDYWGGPYQFMGGAKMTPQIQTVTFKYIPTYSTRLIDFKNAAASLGKSAVTIDVPGTNIFDLMDKSTWLASQTIKTTINGVTGYGPYTGLITFFDPFGTNITCATASPACGNAAGNYYKFQPFADVHWRFAIADAVNMSLINEQVNNEQGQVANMIAAPGLPPTGSWNSSFAQDYSFNLANVKSNITAACADAATETFTFDNGTAAPSGLFNNSCSAASSAGTTINLSYATGDTVNLDIMQNISSNVNSALASLGYSGLKFLPNAESSGDLLTSAFSGNEFFYNFGWLADYPWVVDFTAAMFYSGGAYPSVDGISYTQLDNLEGQISSPTATAQQVAQLNQQMEAFAASKCLYLLTFYPYTTVFITSNFHGFFYNAAEAGIYFGDTSIS